MHTLTTAILFSWILQGVATPPAALQDVLAGVSRNVKETQATLPDFVCNEKVTSTSFRSGLQRDQKIVESLFSVQNSREHREILAIDGKPAKKGSKMPGMPLNITGSFNYMITATFAPQSFGFYDFALRQKAADAGQSVIEFETRSDQKEMVWNIGGHDLITHDTGQAWIDTAAMQVSRMERNLLHLSSNVAKWKITIDQAPLTIGGKQFWLPKAFLTEITERDTRNTGTFLAEYTNCKKFTAEITIRVQ